MGVFVLLKTFKIAYTKGMKILIWQERQKHNLTLIKLAEKSGISKTTLNDLENEKRSPTLDQLEKIAKSMDITISDLYESKYK